MHLATKPKEAAEAHYQRVPARRINVRTNSAAVQQRFVNMQFDYMHLKGVGIDVFSEGAEFMHDALHLNGTLQYTRRSN